MSGGADLPADGAVLIQSQMRAMAREARRAARVLARSSGTVRNHALEAMAVALVERQAELLAANERDLEAARHQGLEPAMVDRLRLTPARIADMVAGLRQIVLLPDPVGEVTELRVRPNGLRVGRMRVPLGVIAVIYESRPNVTADAAGLCVKSGNAVILRGGSESGHSNRAIAIALSSGLRAAGLPETAVQCVQTTDRAAVGALLTCDRDIDIVIPRGGKGLIQRIMAESRIPVIKHLDGICHTYVDRYADLAMAEALVFNGKMQRPGVCNATEILLVHREIAPEFLPMMARRLHDVGCELRGCPRVAAALREQAPEVPVVPAVPEDWDTEFLAPVLAIRMVDHLEEAMAHIEAHSSRHTDVIVTRDHERAMRFVQEVDSSAVMVNASSRFNDGFQFGLGAEMGISTDKLHVRGPVGLEGLTCQKYIVLGNGQLRQ
jgi:glutamate-5-semialdehyde dehydrogenase